MRRIVSALRIILIFFLITFLGMGIVVSSIAEGDEEQQVNLSFMPKPKIDIMLSKSSTGTSLTNFETDMRNELSRLGVDTDDVRITAVETSTISSNQAGASTIFNSWQKYPSISGANFQANWTLGGEEIYTKANVHWTGFWNDKAKNDSDYTIIFDVMNGDFDPLGFTFRMNNISSNQFKFYALELDVTHQTVTLGKINSWIPSASDPMHGGPLYHTKISASDGNYNDYASSSNSNILSHCNGSRLAYKSYSLQNNVWYKVKIEAKGNNYKIYINNSLVINYTDTSSPILTGGYGPYTDSNPNGHFKNVEIQTQQIKTLREILRLSQWRKDAYKFLVHVQDNEESELNNQIELGEISTKIANEQIYFTPWGTNSNRSQMERLLSLTEDHGKFIDNTRNYQTSITETAEYIKSILGSIEGSQYIIANEPMNVGAEPSDVLENTAEEPYWPYGKWKIEHDYTYFENDLGQYQYTGQYTNNMMKTFDKTGKFSITYKDQNTSPSDIYVHRRPTAMLDFGLDNTALSLRSESYDLDKRSQDNGIDEEQWQYRAIGDNEWTQGKIDNINSDKTYVVQLKVKDFQNTWSYPVSKYATTNKSARPIAMFNLESDVVSKYENINVMDTSYDPAGRDIIRYKWEIYKSTNQQTPIFTETTTSKSPTKTNFLSEGEGEYIIYLTVTNSNNQESEKFGRIFEITDDKIAPEFVATPTSCEWKQEETVNIKFNDRGGSGYKEYEYAITDSQALVEDGWSEKSQKDNDDIEINTEGQKYLHVKGYDKAGNTSIDRALGPYKIDRTIPIVQIDGDFETITTEPINVKVHSEDALSGVKEVRVNGQKVEGTEETEFLLNNNGRYLLEVEDVAGNIYRQELNITNIYQHCNAGLGHPDFPTDIEHCPICEQIEGLKVLNDTSVYDSKGKHVEYENPNNAKIVEYYNNSKELPVEVGSYPFELKVEYEGKEYNTGVEGTYIITPKDITIEDIEAVSREYDGTTIVKLRGGRLVGVEETDINNVGFILPETGTIASKNIGKYYVIIPEITLTGEKAKNYNLIQPKTDTVVVEIEKKRIDPESGEGGVKVVGIQAIDRQYDGTNIVYLQGGELIGIEECDKDKVSFILSETGTIPNKDIGEYKVSIPEIVLTGEEAKNYTITQPKEDEVSVTISKREVYMDYVKGKDKKYDKNEIIEMIGGELQNVVEGEDIKAIVPEKGISESEEIGFWQVQIDEITLQGEDIDNYEIIQPNPEDVTVNILSPDQPKLHIEPYISKINDEELKETIPITNFKDNIGKEITEIIYEKEELKEKIRYADKFEITMRIYNEGIGAGYAQKITNIIPEGLEVIENDETNKKYGWKKQEKDKYETSYLDFDSGIENEINPFENKEVDYREVCLTLKVTEKEMIKEEIIDKATAETVDIANNTAVTTEENEKGRKPEIILATAEAGWKNDNKTITVVASDAACKGIAEYAITKEDKEPQQWEKCNETIWKSTEKYDVGTYYVWVKDKAGNISESKPVEVDKIDKVSPNIVYFTKDILTLTGKAEDNESGISEYQFSKEEEVNEYSSNWKKIYNPGPGEIVKSETINKAGEYYLYVKDQAGNITKSSISITITEEEIRTQIEKEINVTFNYYDPISKKQVSQLVTGIVVVGKESALVTPPKISNVNSEIYGQSVSVKPRGWSTNSEANAEIEIELGDSIEIPKTEDERTYYMSYEHNIKYGINWIAVESHKASREVKGIDIYINSQGEKIGDDQKIELPEVDGFEKWSFNGWTKDEEEPNSQTIEIEQELPNPNGITEYHASYKKDITVDRYVYKNQLLEDTLSGTVYKNDFTTIKPKFILGEISQITVSEDGEGKPLEKAEIATPRGWSTSSDINAEIEIPSSNSYEKEFEDSATYYASYNFGNKYIFIGPDGNRVEGNGGTNVDYKGNIQIVESEVEKFPKLPDSPFGWTPKGWVKGDDPTQKIENTDGNIPQPNVEYYATYIKNIEVDRYVYSNIKLDTLRGIAYKNSTKEVPAEIQLGTTDEIKILLSGNGEILKEPLLGTPRFWSTSQEADAEDTTMQNNEESRDEKSVALNGTAHLVNNQVYYMSYDFKVKLLYNDGENDHEEQRDAECGYDGRTKGDEFWLDDPEVPSSWGANWNFNGWTRDEEKPNGTLVKQNKNGEPNPDKINPESKYYASFKQLITITFDANTGNPPIPDPVSDYKYKNVNEEIEASITIPNNVIPVKDEYIFKGYSKNKDADVEEYIAGRTYEFDESTKVYAIWRKIDENPPTVTFEPDGNTWSKTQKTTVTVEDDACTPEQMSLRYMWTTNSEKPSDEEFVNILTNKETLTKDEVTGKYYVWVSAEDINGNKAITRSNTFYIDNTPPDIMTLEADDQVSVNGGIEITGTARDRDSGIVAYQFSKDDSITAETLEGWNEIEPSTTQEMTQRELVTSAGTWYFYVKDGAGNCSREEVNITSDNFKNMKPVITVEPKDEWTKEVTVSITYPKIIGLEKLYSKNNGESYENYTESFTITENNTTIKAKSKLGELEVEADPVTINNIDNEGPEDLSIQQQGSQAITRSKDNGSGIKAIRVTFNGSNLLGEIQYDSDWVNANIINAGYYQWTLGDIWGTGKLTLYARDKLGNESHIEKQITNTDNSPPVIQLVSTTNQGFTTCPYCRQSSGKIKCIFNLTSESGSGILDYNNGGYVDIIKENTVNTVEGHSICIRAPAARATSGQFEMDFYIHGAASGYNGHISNLAIQDAYGNLSNKLSFEYNF